MSNPSALALHDHQHHRTPQPPPPPPPSSVPPLTPSPSPSPSPSTSLARDYRKGNWTLHETLILISAKRLDDDRRRTAALCSGSAASPRAAELRWKWVENYCWKNGCQRSQNQCNDKWDNLLRDYKKVRDFASAAAAAAGGPTYWTMEKNERKDRGLPSNLSSEVFEALTDVLSRRNAHRGSAARTPTPTPPAPSPQLTIAPPPLPPPQTTIAPPPMLPPPPPAEYTLHPSPSAEVSGSSECSGSSAKRRRVRGIGRSVARASSVLARTLLACEERRDKRHRDRVVLEERRLRLEEEQAEVNRQGIAGLIAAVNGLSGAIHDLVADHQRGTGAR